MPSMVSLAMAQGSLPGKMCTKEWCGREDHLALCELCMHWVCQEHRMLLGQGGMTLVGPIFY